MTFQVDKDNPAFSDCHKRAFRNLDAVPFGQRIHAWSKHTYTIIRAPFLLLPGQACHPPIPVPKALPSTWWHTACRPCLQALAGQPQEIPYRSRVQRWGLLVLTASDSFQEYTRHNKRNPTKESSRAMTSQPQPGVKATMQKHNLALLWELEPKSQCWWQDTCSTSQKDYWGSDELIPRLAKLNNASQGTIDQNKEGMKHLQAVTSSRKPRTKRKVRTKRRARMDFKLRISFKLGWSCEQQHWIAVKKAGRKPWTTHSDVQSIWSICCCPPYPVVQSSFKC